MTCFRLLQNCWNGAFLKHQTVSYVVQGTQYPYPVWLQVSTLARAIHVAAWSGAPFLSRHIRERGREQKKSKPTPRDRLTGNRFVRAGETAHVLWEKQHIRWLIMANEGGPHARTRLPWCDPNHAASRHSSEVCRRQNNHHHRANSAIGGRLRRGSWTKELKVLEIEGGMPGSWLENLVIPSWSGMPKIICPFRLDNANSYQDLWWNPEKSKQDSWKDNREGFMLDMATSRYQGVEIPKHIVRKTSTSLWAHQQ